MTLSYTSIKPELIRSNMMHNDDMIAQFMAMYISQIPKDFRALAEAMQQQDYSLIVSKAHHIKPTLHYVGAQELVDKLIQLEHAAKTQQPFDQLDKLHAEVQQWALHLMDEIKTFTAAL